MRTSKGQRLLQVSQTSAEFHLRSVQSWNLRIPTRWLCAFVLSSTDSSPGQIFSYPVKLTWEFTADAPIRSVFPLWPVYGLPMTLLKWVWIGNGHDGDIPPAAVFYTLRILMFVLSFVLEDWALHELVQSPRHRRVAVLLVASSYVTWTYQTHTFSNSIETLGVAWSLVLIQRIVNSKVRDMR